MESQEESAKDSPIAKIACQLYMDRPESNLYHYTSLGALLKIIPEQVLFATDARFLNDFSELRVLANHLRMLMMVRTTDQTDSSTRSLYQQFREWLAHRFNECGHALFVTCLTQEGNLLSQWRSYGEPNKGISLGFDPDVLQRTAHDQQFMLGPCIYDTARQIQLAKEVLHAVELLAQTRRVGRTEPIDYRVIFINAEAHLLRIAILFKDPAFIEEKEWRLVSPIIASYEAAPIFYREGRSQLVPYMKFKLPTANDRKVDIKHAWLGPTPHQNSSLLAVSQFLAKADSPPRHGIGYCGIPYRTS